MRLKHIKLAGFKSFVDPTTVSFPSNLCAIVGPNGCGKSNIIDAVRWVMGESSAKHLRGESMADVIFSGSNSRKPVGQANIELVFDNSDGTLKGEYASFNEISIKRKVTRDGQNNYYLNGSKCRRRDIVDIFLGTGLGPRSYSIIEQGMISRLIEAKPEELRVFIEEAAGISKYKERRRDTENRMRRTQENLERLTDIREELDRQLSRLERQAKSAEKYAEYKQEEREVKSQLMALQYRVLDNQSKAQQGDIQQQELSIEALVTKRVNLDTSIEKNRAEYAEKSDTFNEIQGRYYSVGTDIAKVEQSIQHIQERNRQLNDDLVQTKRESKEVQIHLEGDQGKADTWQLELAEIEPQLEELQAAEVESGHELLTTEETMQQWQQQWDEFNRRAEEPRQRVEVEQSRIQHLEQVQTRLHERINRLEGELSQPDDESANINIPELQQALAQKQEEQVIKQEFIANLVSAIEQNRETIFSIEESLNEKRTQLQSARGRYASLDALQQAALNGDKPLNEWLDTHDLADKPRLLSKIQVQPQWQSAVELVLGDTLQAVCIEGVEEVATRLSGLDQGNLMLLEAAKGVPPKMDTLASVCSGHGVALSFLNQVYITESLQAALDLRHQLSEYESLITPDGLWIGKHWLRVKRQDDDQAGVLARQEELEQVSKQLIQLDTVVEELGKSLKKSREQLKSQEQQREQSRRELDDLNREVNREQSQLDAHQVRLEQEAKRQQKLTDDIAEAKEQLRAEGERLSQSRGVLEEAILVMEKDTQEKESLLTQRDDIRGLLDQSRQRARHDKDQLHALAMHHQSIKTQLVSILESINRLQEQMTRLELRREQLQSAIGDGDDPTEEYQEQLAALLERRIGIEEEMMSARKQLENVEQALRDTERERSTIDSELQDQRTQLTEIRLQAQTVQVHRENIAKQLLEEGGELQALLQKLSEDASEEPLQSALELIHGRITRLGAINLAAIDEFKIESERKEYLDAQDSDLREALETLENAIIKIDKETRTRFKETFDQINHGVQELFPKVFGGGHAYLELTGEDLLDTGVAIMARPPGKRNSTIHLLSGGEKALTAIALVFSIFRLNPAPFCMLDEVDAPLDDANVFRYARLVAEMSEHVQFIYITHNKISMEVAQQLMGVTMHEAGCSRLVTVDVDEAAELAAV